MSTGSDGTDTGTDTGTAEDPSLSLSGQFWVFPRGTKCEVTLLLKPNTNKLVCVSSEWVNISHCRDHMVFLLSVDQ